MNDAGKSGFNRPKVVGSIAAFLSLIGLGGGTPLLIADGWGMGSPPMWHSPAHLRRVRHKGKMERVKRRGMGRK